MFIIPKICELLNIFFEFYYFTFITKLYIHIYNFVEQYNKHISFYAVLITLKPYGHSLII